MQRLLFTVLIFSNVLFIQGQKGPASSAAKTVKGLNIDELYQKYITKNERMRSEACLTEKCKLDVLITRFSSETETASIVPTSRPSFFGDILQWLLQKKLELVGTVGGLKSILPFP